MADDHCRLDEGSREGWRALTLSSGALAVTVLPDRGAEIVGLVDVASGVDVLFRAPWGLQPPDAPPRDGSDGHAFLENYGGGWQELFPSAGDACTAFRLDWDPAFFRWIVSWQPYGGARAMPLAGAYALGIEPWTTRRAGCCSGRGGRDRRRSGGLDAGHGDRRQS